MRSDLKRAVKAVADGLSFGEAGQRFGLSRNQVAGACRRAGVRVGRYLSDGTPRGRDNHVRAALALRADPARDAARLRALKASKAENRNARQATS
jgi:hypothetical protein